MPLYTKWLTDVEYGITGIANSFITTMSFIVSFSLFSAITRFYVDYKNDEKKLKEFYGTVVLFTLLSLYTDFRLSGQEKSDPSTCERKKAGAASGVHSL